MKTIDFSELQDLEKIAKLFKKCPVIRVTRDGETFAYIATPECYSNEIAPMLNKGEKD